VRSSCCSIRESLNEGCVERSTQRLSAEAADNVRREHFSILGQAITESGGPEVKDLGDTLILGSASAALAVPWPCSKGDPRVADLE
jgi:hypothetical protein